MISLGLRTPRSAEASDITAGAKGPSVSRVELGSRVRVTRVILTNAQIALGTGVIANNRLHSVGTHIFESAVLHTVSTLQTSRRGRFRLARRRSGGEWVTLCLQTLVHG